VLHEHGNREADQAGDAVDIGYGHKRIEGNQVERIIAEGIAVLAIALALLMPIDALAQSRTSYDASGRVSGRWTTGNNGSTTFYDASSRVTGRTSTGSSGTTTIYDAGGRSVGTVTTPPSLWREHEEAHRALHAELAQQPKPTRPRKRRPTLAGVARQAAKAGIPVARYDFRPDGTIVTGKPVGDIDMDDTTASPDPKWN
jgi:YD repeat-containing protein